MKLINNKNKISFISIKMGRLFRKTFCNLISLFTILLIMEFSNEFKLDSKKVINGYKIRNLQTQYTTPFTTPYTTINGTNNTHINISPKSGKGLKAGGIIAIVIPCVAALIAVGALAALCRGTSTPAPIQAIYRQPVPGYIDTSLDKFKAPDPKAPMQNIAVVQEVPVVQQPVTLLQQVPPKQNIVVVQDPNVVP